MSHEILKNHSRYLHFMTLRLMNFSHQLLNFISDLLALYRFAINFLNYQIFIERLLKAVGNRS